MSGLARPTSLVAYRALSDALGKGAFFIVTVIAARRLASADFGLFSLGTTVGWMAAVASDFGIQLHVARRVAQDPPRAGAVLRTWLRVRIVTALIVIGVVGAALAVLAPASSVAEAVLMFALVYVLNGLLEFLYYFFRGLGRTDLESTLTIAQRGTLLALAVAALSVAPSVMAVALAMLIPAIGSLAMASRWAFRLAATEEAATGPSAASAPGSERSWGQDQWSNVLPIGLGIVLSALYFRIDVLLLERWSGMTSVGLYNAVFRLVEALRLFPAAVLAVALPALCRATNRDLLTRLSAALTGGAAVASAALWAVAAWLIPFVYGSGFADSVPAFRILLLSFPLMSLNYALTHQLIGWHGHRAYAVMCAAAVAFNVVLNARLIPASGIVGAAWSTLATEAVITLGCVLALARTSIVPATELTTLESPAVPS